MVHATMYATMKWKYSVVIINSKARTLIFPATVVFTYHIIIRFTMADIQSLSENIPRFRPQQKSCS